MLFVENFRRVPGRLGTHGPDTTEAESRQLSTDCRCANYSENSHRVRYTISLFF